MESRIPIALVAAKLRNLKHYCPEAIKHSISSQRIADDLADSIERLDATITPIEFKRSLETALRNSDPQDYDLREKGTLMPIQRLFFIEFVLEGVLPPQFYHELRATYPSSR